MAHVSSGAAPIAVRRPARSTPRANATRAGRLPVADAGAAALGAFAVVSVGLTDGGYSGRGSLALTSVFAATAALGAVGRGSARPTRTGLALIGLLAALSAWTLLSSSWAVDGALVEQETWRCTLYAAALAAVVFVVDRHRRAAFLFGLGGGIVLVGVAALGMRAASGAAVDRFYGTLLREPVGYPNALGVLAALGVVLALGLDASGSIRRALRGSAALLVLVLGATGSRGAALALVLGLCTLVLLTTPGTRLQTGLAALATVSAGGATWIASMCLDAEGGSLVPLALAAFVAGASVPGTLGAVPRRLLLGLAACALAGVVAIAVLRPVATTSSFRASYWAAALEEARDRPVLGTGAGSFHLTWAERGTEGMFVRDAHSLYVEALSELGPVGLVLVLALVGLPLGAAIRGRGDPLTAAAAGAFVVFAVHAGLDWDWEMPVVTLAGLGLAATAVTGGPIHRRTPSGKGG